MADIKNGLADGRGALRLACTEFKLGLQFSKIQS